MSSSNEYADGNLSNQISRGSRSFQLVGGVAALLAALVFRRWLSAEFGLLQSLGLVHVYLQTTSTNPLDWFLLLRTNPFVGLLLLNLFDTVNYLLAALMYLGIYSHIRTSYRDFTHLPMFLVAMGTAAYLMSNQAMIMLSLSTQYFAATDEGRKLAILAAGQYALTVNNPVAFGTGVFWAYLLLYGSGMVLSIASLSKHAALTPWIAIVGIVANAFGLGYFITALLGPTLSIIPALGSAPMNLVWYIAIGIELIRHATKGNLK